MKKALFVLIVTAICLFACAALAADVQLNEVNFPDTVFRDYAAGLTRTATGISARLSGMPCGRSMWTR